MSTRTRIDMSDLGSSSKRSASGSTPSSSSSSSRSPGAGVKSNRTKSIAMMAGLVVLLGAVALVYGWEYIFPEKVSQEDIGPPPDPNNPPPSPAPNKPADPNNPDSNLPPGIISG